MRGAGINGPDAGIVVGAAGTEMADIRGEKDPSDVRGMSLEGGHSNEGGDVAVLEHAPDIDVPLFGLVSPVQLSCIEGSRLKALYAER